MEELQKKYLGLKQANKVLKAGILDKQDDCGKLEQQLKEKEATLRQQLEEIDHLQFQNGRMSKQLGMVTAQLEEQKLRQQQQSGWSVQGLISGKQQQDDLRVLQNELMMKIQENEDLHMKLFELQTHHEEENQRLKDANAAASNELKVNIRALEVEKDKSRQLLQDVQNMTARISELADELVATNALADSLRSTLEAERFNARSSIRNLEGELKRWMPFDEAQHATWNAWNMCSQRGRDLHQRHQALLRMQATVAEACGHSCGIFRAWTKALGDGSDEESGKRLRLRTKASDTAEGLAKTIGEQLPKLLGIVDVLQALPHRGWKQELETIVSSLLHTHRKWVMYQSLLLLHDWNSSYAQRFVDWLWRLHRCVCALFSRIRIFVCVAGLVACGKSAEHFALARNAAMRGREARIGAAASTVEVAAHVVQLLRKAVQDVAQCWEGIGRCLSGWATAQVKPAAAEAASQGVSSLAELLEAVHRFNACLVERVAPALAQLAEGAMTSAPSAPGRQPGGYLVRAASKLAQAPGAAGFEELRARAAAQLLLGAELRQQVRRLQAVSDEKAALAEELCALQDKHELLRSRCQVLQSGGISLSAGPGAGAPQLAAVPGDTAQASGPRSDRPLGGAPGELLLSSRQRALLESLSVTAQESSSLRQHGFFVEVLSLSPGNVALAGGALDGESVEAPCWELAVRRVYEQHVRLLQGQIQAADGKAMELHLAVQQNMDILRQEEAAKLELRDEAKATQSELQNVQEDMVLTRKNYDNQLAMLTEHICTLSGRLSEKDANLASFQAQQALSRS